MKRRKITNDPSNTVPIRSISGNERTGVNNFAQLASLLTILEVKGLIRQLPGKYYQTVVKISVRPHNDSL